MKCSVILCIIWFHEDFVPQKIFDTWWGELCVCLFFGVLCWFGLATFWKFVMSVFKYFAKLNIYNSLARVCVMWMSTVRTAVSVNMWSVYSNTPDLWPQVLSLKDLDRIWAAQDGKHEIIVKNIHDMLVKLAWDFSAEQLDHLFGCFQVRGSEVDGPCLNAQSILPHAGNK